MLPAGVREMSHKASRRVNGREKIYSVIVGKLWSKGGGRFHIIRQAKTSTELHNAMWWQFFDKRCYN